MNDIAAEDKKLKDELEDFKRVHKDVVAAVIKASTDYRVALLALHEVGLKLGTTLKQLGETDRKIKWANEFVQMGQIQETITTLQYNWQCKFWDLFILPMMNATESEKQTVQTVEKKLKTASAAIDAQAKKLKSTAKKGKTMSASDWEYKEAVAGLMDKQTQLAKYLRSNKQKLYHSWLSRWCAALDTQKVFHEKANAILSTDRWKKTLESKPDEAPEDIEALVSGAPSRASVAPFKSNESSSQLIQPSTSSSSYLQEPEEKTKARSKSRSNSISEKPSLTERLRKMNLFANNHDGKRPQVTLERVLKTGYLNTQSGEPKKSEWNKYYYVLSHEKQGVVLSNFTSDKYAENQETPIASLELSSTFVAVEKHEGNSMILTFKDQRTQILQSETTAELDDWFKLFLYNIKDHDPEESSFLKTAGQEPKSHPKPPPDDNDASHASTEEKSEIPPEPETNAEATEEPANEVIEEEPEVQEVSDYPEEVVENPEEEIPAEEFQGQEEVTEEVVLPEGWAVYYSEDGYPYYCNQITGETTWELPQ